MSGIAARAPAEQIARAAAHGIDLNECCEMSAWPGSGSRRS